MIGKLRLNKNGRWEVINDKNERVELTSGDCIEINVGGQWIATRVECGWNAMKQCSEYYSVVRGTKLVHDLPARIDGY